jgi:predicted ATPase/DNA-binding CsgD family transcriptional regulator
MPVGPHNDGPPIPSTSLVGRDHEVAAVTGMMLANRLVTLTGPGGTGKTRLALEVARGLVEIGHTVAFVDLAALDSPDSVIGAVLASLGLRVTKGRDPAELVRERVAGTPTTIVLDNFEHLVAAAPGVTELLAASPELRMLVTSRKRLRVSPERVFEVPPLPVPAAMESAEALLGCPSVRLFLERAEVAGGPSSLHGGELEVVGAICRRLEGLPLAIELAAARARHLSVQALLGRLDRALPLLSGGPIDAPTRHRALRHTISWSFELLEPPVAAFFGDLGVFDGPFSLEAAHHVAGPHVGPGDEQTLDALTELADQSLIQARHGGEGEIRFALHDAIREFAVTVARDEALARDRHLEHYVRLAELAEPALEGPEQARWTRVLVDEQENIRGALRWAFRSSASEQLLRLAAALGNFWRFHGDLREGREWLSRAIMGAQPGREVLVAKAQRRVARICSTLGEFDQARLLYDSARRNAEAADDPDGVAEALVSMAGLLIEWQQDTASIPACIDEGLRIARERGNLTILALGSGVLATWKHTEGRTEEAKPLYRETARLARGLGDLRVAAVSLVNLADIHLVEGDPEAAIPLLSEGVRYLDQIGDLAYAPWAHMVLGLAYLRRGDMALARESIDRGGRLALEVASPMEVILAAEASADWLGAAGAHREALVAWAAASYAREDMDIPRQPTDDGWVDAGMHRDRAALSEAGAATAWAAGGDASLRDVVLVALDTLRRIPIDGAGPADPRLGSPSRSADPTALTDREVEVLGLLVQGLTDGQIAERLFISPKTASVHVANIKGKLGGASRVDTVTRALRLGLVAIPEAPDDA